MKNPNRFIATEIFSDRGEVGEKLVWDSVIRAFERRECVAYWRYPIFDRQQFRKEPDILIADRLFGLIVIEVKAIEIDRLVDIQGHRWQYQNFYTQFGNPYQQAEKQLFALLNYCDREALLRQKVTARATVALPYITQSQWQHRRFNRLPSSPPILFQEHLAEEKLARELIEQVQPLVFGEELTTTQWELLQAVLGGTSLYTPVHQRQNCPSHSRRKIIQQVRSRLNQLDLQQEKIAKQIPPGMQRIRGIAGSGKTVILCQRAALMSLKHPEWQIALVFFTRSLYDTITQQVDKWLRYFTGDRIGYDADNSNLKILHAWGSKQQPGFYSTICKATRTLPLSVLFTTSSQPNEALAEACVQLLENKTIPQIFDAVLIDEGQDLISDRWKYRDKQPFYWLAYQALRTVNPISPQQKRLIWAYDELQSLSSSTVPEPVELFGEELGHLVTGQHNQQINKTEIIARCYRTPQQIITIAHAIALGLFRDRGILTGSIYPEEWQALGYKITGNWQLGTQVTLKREQSPNIIGELWQGEMICCDRFASRQQELTALAEKLKQNLAQDRLQPDRELLIIVLGSAYDAASLVKQTATFLINCGINIYLPTHNSFNCLDSDEPSVPNRFWYPGAITISTIHRAKGQEADLVYLIGLDLIARDESNLYLRQQLFTALTRTRAWVNLSGVGDYLFYRELSRLIEGKDELTFTVTSLPQRELSIGDRASLLRGYALGRRNFRYANLSHANLSGTNLSDINLIEADLSNANLEGTNLTNAKLIAANLSNANLANADLTKAKLIGADLTDANLTDTKLTGANLTNAVLNWALL